MPGRGSYGPAGKWVYQRAKHIRSKNPNMDESTSFAIATQQAHKVGKSSKRHRTEAGVLAAHAKMRRPMESYKKTAGIRGIGGIGSRGKRLLGRVKKIPLKQTSQEGVSLLPSVLEQKDNTKTANVVTVSALFDELEKIAQEAPMQPPAPTSGSASGVMGLSGGAGSPPQDPSSLMGSKTFGANKQKPIEPADVVSGSNSSQGAPGLPKIGGVASRATAGLLGRVSTGLGAKAVESPGMAYWRFQQQKKGLSKHKQTMLALKHGYPAGWVGLNMKPG